MTFHICIILLPYKREQEVLKKLITSLALFTPFFYCIGFAYREGWFSFFELYQSMFPKPTEELILYGVITAIRVFSDTIKTLHAGYLNLFISIFIYTVYAIIIVYRTEIRESIANKDIPLARFLNKTTKTLILSGFFLLMPVFLFAISFTTAVNIGKQDARQTLEKIEDTSINEATIASWENNERAYSGKVIFCDHIRCIVITESSALLVKNIEDLNIYSKPVHEE